MMTNQITSCNATLIWWYIKESLYIVEISIIKCHMIHTSYKWNTKNLTDFFLFICTHHPIQMIKTNFYRFWKLKTLMDTAKIKAKSNVKPTTAAAATPTNSCLKPKYSLTNSSTVSPVSSLFFLSPNSDAVIPYKVQAIGHTQEYHLHQIGILCIRKVVSHIDRRK